MAAISDPTATDYANNLRIFAGVVIALNTEIPKMLAYFNTVVKPTDDWQQATGTDEILDGAANDSRGVITKGNVAQVNNGLQAILDLGIAPDLNDFLKLYVNSPVNFNTGA